MKRGRAAIWIAGAIALPIGSVSCNAFTGVDEVEFGPAADSATASSGGSGATSAQGGSAQGGSGGTGLTGGGGGGLTEDGSPCVTSATCASASCVDGVCCDAPCAGLCQACVAVKTGAPDGTCAAVTTGTDPDVECGNGQTCCGPTCGACGGEDCTNAVDDDLDGKIDCADEQCAAFQCIPAPPPGSALALYWLGAGPPPGCPNAYPSATAGGVGVDAPPLTCGACGCDPSTGATCGAATVTFFGGGNCAGGGTVFNALPGSCVPTPGLSGIDSVKAGALPVVGGSCSANGGGVANQVPWSWQTEGVICQAGGTGAGRGCGAGEVCAPAPSAPFEAKTCAIVAGGACSAPYGEVVTIYSSVDDNRACTGCTCGGPTGSTCTSQTLLFGTPGCTATTNTLPNDGSCDGGVNNDTESLQVQPAMPTPGMCAQAGGNPVGGALATSPYTLCCATVP